MKASLPTILLLCSTLIYGQTELSKSMQDPEPAYSGVQQFSSDVSNTQSSENKATEAFPEDAWGVYSWFGLGKVSKERTPHIKGTPIILRWSNLEPENGKFEFDKEIRQNLEYLHENDFNTFLMIWVAFSTSRVSDKDTTWVFTPKWIFNNGVPLVEFPETINPLGVVTRRFFPHYLDDDYKYYFHRMIDSLGQYILDLPEHLRSRILFIQSAEGSTGDGQPYKGEPINPAYDITKEQWSEFRIETWERYKSAFTVDGELQFPLLTNYDSNEEDQYRWMLDSLPKALGLKNGMFSHGYHISDAQVRLENFIQFRNEVEAVGKVFFARGEQDAEWKTYGWSTQNPAQAFYWSALYATHCGLSMWNVPWEACEGQSYADAIKLFNKYAAETNPATARGAFCALRRGLDAADTEAFPEDRYGLASKTNTQRYIDIADAFSEYGANQGDPGKATGGGMVNRKRMDYNDVGWKILKGNYKRHITQIDPEKTSIAWWQIDESIYGRFARGFDVQNDKNTMYFDVDDRYFRTNQDQGSGWLKVKVTYFADDGGSWDLRYHAMDGSMKIAFSMENEVGKGWMTKEVVLEDALLDNGGPRGADLILQNLGNKSCRFHMIDLEKEVILPEQTYQSPYEGKIQNIPGTIEAEHFDEGGEGFAFHDDDIKEGDLSFRAGDNVDIIARSSASNGYSIGFTENGEWLEYTTDVASGVYDISLHYYCDTDAGGLEVYLDTSLLATIGDIENLGIGNPGEVRVEDVHIKGGKKKLLKLQFIDGAGFEVDAITFSRQMIAPVQVSVGPIPSKDLYIGNSYQLYATISPLDATEKSVTWSSSDTSVAKVDSFGLVQAVSEGSAEIKASTSDNTIYGTCNFAVAIAKIAVEYVELMNCPYYDMTPGSVRHLSVNVYPENADDRSVSWSSSDVSVATVNSSGWVTAVAEGTATISVTTVDGGFSDICSVGVESELINASGVDIENCPADPVLEGDSMQFIGIIDPPDATDTSLFWSSSDTEVAKVSSTGVVIFVSPGSSTITALSADGFAYDQCDLIVDQKIGTRNSEGNSPGFAEVFPNPAKDRLNIRLNDQYSAGRVSIYNSSGREIYKTDMYSSSLEVDLNEINKGGMILVKVVLGGNSTAFRVIIK